jgi:hypothetical protein
VVTVNSQTPGSFVGGESWLDIIVASPSDSCGIRLPTYCKRQCLG